jgi:hypothetical protein
MFEYLIIFGAGVIVFAFFIFVMSTKKPPGDKSSPVGCCGGEKEKSDCRRCSEPIRMPGSEAGR